MIAAKASGKPVKWVCTRTKASSTDTHGRGNIIDGELALDKDGKFLAMRLDWVERHGLVPVAGGDGPHPQYDELHDRGLPHSGALQLVPRRPHQHRPVAAYRGAGRPDIAYAVERLVSQAAAELRMDPAELRRRNFIPPDAFPYTSQTGGTYEYADMPGCSTRR